MEESKTKNKKLIKNLSLITLSNIIAILNGVITGFIIPKIMGTYEYGFYKIFTLYIGYVGLLHFGFCDGLHLLLSGKEYGDLDKEKMRTLSRFFLLFQGSIAALISIISLFFMRSDYGFVFLFVGITLFANNVTTYYQLLSQAVSKFKELSIRNIIRSGATLLITGIIFVLAQFNIINALSFKIYIIIVTAINVLLMLWYIFTYRDITFGKGIKLKDAGSDIKSFFTKGVIVMASNLTSTILLLVDRQFVSIYFDKSQYGIYSFAYQMLTIVTTAISAISTIMYPSLKKLPKENIKNKYNKLLKIILIIIALSLFSYFPLQIFVTYFLPDYVGSLAIFKIIMPSLLLTSTITMLISNYYKAFERIKSFFFISLGVVVISVGLNFAAYYIFKTTTAISWASIIASSIWYITLVIYLDKKEKISSASETSYLVLMVISFYIATMNSNIIISIITYLISFVLFTVCLFRNKFFK